MTDHPITPPPELVVEWADTIYQQTEDDDQRDLYVATRAAQWGADQELEACVKLLELSDKNARDFLYSARRPKPPSLKEQALDAHNRMMAGTETQDDWMIIRRALEALPK
jgi:hypothetical protein